MEQLLEKTKAELGRSVVLLLLLGLWGMIWLGIQPGSVRDVVNPGSFTDFLHGLRAASPFVAAGSAVIYALVRILKRDKRRYFLFGPLALTAVYGLVGIAVSLRSPDTSAALYWASLYLTVPLILLAATLSQNPLRQVERIIQFNWLIIVLGFAVFLIVGLNSLDFGQALLNPLDLLKCQQAGNWFEHSSGALRSTGVGRFAAVTGIISFSLVWKGNLRAIWSVAFFASLTLLLFTGARGSIVPFAVAVPVVFWLMGGKTAKIVAGVGLVIFGSIILSTGIGGNFLSGCLLTETTAAQVEYLGMRSPTQSVTSSQTPPGTDPSSPQDQVGPSNTEDDPSDSGFYTASGRTQIWTAGWKFIKLSPVLGYGFHGDRLVLGTHMHNSVLHAMIQTGLLGTIPLVGAILWAWYLLIATLRRLDRLGPMQKTTVIQAAGMLIFLSLRSLSESTGAFFGIDWLLLGPLLLYLQLVNSAAMTREEDS